ncbi:MAG: hypothetical protein OXE96_15180 [Gemmatimonadetes bacterium]|nr:hypothetical protein [Gemmatimonadota bacterium]
MIDEHRAAAIVGALAKEESAKVLILLDLVRCPRNNQDGRSKTVQAFGNHLAKEIYADACDWRPVDFDEVTKIVNRERRPYYLDGPSDVGWILPNYAKARRENRMYVDYVQDITVEHGEYGWVSPLPDSLHREHGDATPTCLVVARALHRVGMTTPEGLAAVADLWRGFEPQPQTTRQEVQERNYNSLVRVSQAHPNREVDPKDARAVCHHWPFPLWSLDLRQSGPARADLAEIRRQRAEHIEWLLKRASERDPAPLITREKVEELTKAHSDFKLEWDRLIESLPGHRDSGLRIVSGSVRSYGLESYERLRRRVGNLEVEELIDLAALGWFGRQPESGWAHWHQHARRIISDASVGYVCGLGQHWMTGLRLWEGPPQLPARLTIGGATG